MRPNKNVLRKSTCDKGLIKQFAVKLYQESQRRISCKIEQLVVSRFIDRYSLSSKYVGYDAILCFLVISNVDTRPHQLSCSYYSVQINVIIAFSVGRTHSFFKIFFF